MSFEKQPVSSAEPHGGHFDLSLLLVTIFFIFFGVVMIAQAGKSDIQYPVAELGGCGSETECFSFCELPENYSACLSFASRNDLLEIDEIKKAEKMIKAVASQNTPGGCSSGAECEAYCSSVSTLDECVSFGEKHEFMDERRLDESKKILKALNSGVKLPGGCQSEIECEQYCSNGSNMQECVSFAKETGFMNEKEIAEMERVIPLMQKGMSPGGCTSRESCDAYCEDESHIDECMDFAEKAGFISPEEVKMIKKTGGKGPGGCKGKRECDRFCGNPDNNQVCVEFGIEHGLISPKDAEIMKKTGGKGPGGCKGKEECDSFCNNPDNQEACFSFAKDNGLISEDELKLIEKHRTGPGGCITKEACSKYCSDENNFEECSQFGPGDNNQKGSENSTVPYDDPDFVGPGGCKSSEECKNYCSDPLKGDQECQSFFKANQMKYDENRDFFKKNKDVEKMKMKEKESERKNQGDDFKEYPPEEFKDFDEMKTQPYDDENWNNQGGDFEDWENKPGFIPEPKFDQNGKPFPPGLEPMMDDFQKDNMPPVWEVDKPDQFRPENRKFNPPTDRIKTEGNFGKEDWDSKSDWKMEVDWSDDPSKQIINPVDNLQNKQKFESREIPVINEVKEFFDNIPLNNFPSDGKESNFIQPVPSYISEPAPSFKAPEPPYVAPELNYVPEPMPSYSPLPAESAPKPSYSAPEPSSSYSPPPPTSGGNGGGDFEGGGGDFSGSSESHSLSPRSSNANFVSFVGRLFGSVAKKMVVAFSL